MCDLAAKMQPTLVQITFLHDSCPMDLEGNDYTELKSIGNVPIDYSPCSQGKLTVTAGCRGH